MRRPAGPVRLALCAIAFLLVSFPLHPAQAFELGDGFVEVHGSLQMEFRGIADGFELTNWNPHKWSFTGTAEAEFDLLPDGWGPISLLQGFIRVEGRYDCVWQSMCHIATGQRLYGDQANRVPAQFANGKTSGHTGRFPNPGSPSEPIHGSGARILALTEIPPLGTLLGIGGDATQAALDRALAPTKGALFAAKHVQGSVAPSTFLVGPWAPYDVKANGLLRDITTVSPTGAPIPITQPLRPDQGTLFSPSPRLRQLIEDFDDLDVNFSENELQWNRGASQQQTKELKEAYLDIEFLDGQLFLRAGRQTTVWGKTELFRAQDQFNPQDIALGTLSSLEASRIALWSIRGIWSFWDVGPFQDVRLEFAANIDHYEPTDLGTCGEPYTIWLVCGKKAGAFAHGLTGIGLAGEERPQDPWNSTRGLEVGLRLEFRWERFSFAITDFYGFPDIFVLDTFNEYFRNVDPATGMPRIAGATGIGNCTTGAEPACLTGLTPVPMAAVPVYTGGLDGNADKRFPVNRQLFDVVCAATAGLVAEFGQSLGGILADECILDVFNSIDRLNLAPFIVNLPVKAFLGRALAGADWWNGLVPVMSGALPDSEFIPAIELHPGGNEGPEQPFMNNTFFQTCGTTLTDHQEALLGTGRFFHRDTVLAPDGTDFCGAGYNNARRVSNDTFTTPNRLEYGGIDLLWVEASVLLSAFPQFDGPAGSRFVPGTGLVTLPGARSPFTFFQDPVGFRYDPFVDGCVVDLNTIYAPAEVAMIPNAADCNGVDLVDPRTGTNFSTEMEAFSYNFMALLAGLSGGFDSPCDPTVATAPGDQSGIMSCALVSGVFALAGARRPDVSAGGNGRYGRRDAIWAGGGEVRLLYKRRNVLGFAMDFAEDRSKMNFGVEFVWFADEPFGDTHEKNGWSKHDVVSLTVSADRPTFVNFLNANRTIFINAQFFVRYIDGYTDKRLAPDGPFSMLATLSFFTGFWQDRLLTFTTVVHELESNSSGLITGFTYRMSERFSVGVSLTTFRGEPRSSRMARVPLALSSTSGNDYESRTRYNGLTAVSDREELGLSIRYTY